MKTCECCDISGTDDCKLIYQIYLSNDDDELILQVCHLCHALIKSHLPSANDGGSQV